MPKPYSEDIRKRVIQKKEAGKTVSEIIEELDVKPTFIYDMLRRSKNNEPLTAKAASGGRPPAIGEAELRQIEALIIETPDITLSEIKETLNLSSSISRICDAINYKLKLPHKKRRYSTRDKTVKM